MKMYILIRDALPPGLAMLTAAHAGLAGYLEWSQDPEMIEWLQNSFKKVVCKVSDEEFKKYRTIVHRGLVMHEDTFGWKDGEKKDEILSLRLGLVENPHWVETALIFRPRKEWPKEFKKFKLWK